MNKEYDPEPKFIVDEMLGTLAKWLRIIGYDTVYYTGGGDSALVQRALAEDRIILTRDTLLLERKLARKKLFISEGNIGQQLKQVVEELNLDVQSRLFTRCLICNNKLIAAKKGDIKDKVPGYTYITQEKFYECPECGKIYWPGTHKDKMVQMVGDIDA